MRGAGLLLLAEAPQSCPALFQTLHKRKVVIHTSPFAGCLALQVLCHPELHFCSLIGGRRQSSRHYRHSPETIFDVKFREFNFFPIFFGSGLGSASVTNNVYEGVVLGVFNPNSQFVRLLYASGLSGFLFFILAFTHPVKYLTKNLDRRTQNHFILYMLLLVGCSFGVRSPVPYIYLGVFISVMSLSGQNSQLLKHKEK